MPCLGADGAALSPELLDARIADGESPAAARFRPSGRRWTRSGPPAAGARAGGPALGRRRLARPAAATRHRHRRRAPARHRDRAEPGDGFPLADFAGLPAAEILTLTPLEPAAVATFLAQQADGPVHGSWAGVVHRLGGGNPLYIRELARLLARGDRLRGPASEVDLPDGLRRLVARRTAQLSDAGRDLLGGAAALGAEVDVAVLRAAAPEPAAVDPLLAEAVRAGLLIDDPWHPATLRFAHDLVRRARYGELSRTERIGWHARIADALEAAGRHRPRSRGIGSGRRWMRAHGVPPRGPVPTRRGPRPAAWTTPRRSAGTAGPSKSRPASRTCSWPAPRRPTGTGNSTSRSPTARPCWTSPSRPPPGSGGRGGPCGPRRCRFPLPALIVLCERALWLCSPAREGGGGGGGGGVGGVLRGRCGGRGGGGRGGGGEGGGGGVAARTTLCTRRCCQHAFLLADSGDIAAPSRSAGGRWSGRTVRPGRGAGRGDPRAA